jgi:hypothetical protein
MRRYLSTSVRLVVAALLVTAVVASGSQAKPMASSDRPSSERQVLDNQRSAALGGHQARALSLTRLLEMKRTVPASRLSLPRWWTIGGSVLTPSAIPVAGATVVWTGTDSTGQTVGGQGSTDASGSFAFGGSGPVASLSVGTALPEGLGGGGYVAWGQPLADGSALNFVLQPGLATFTTTRTADADWNGWQSVQVQTSGSAGGGITNTGATGSAFVMPPDFSYACVYYWGNQGVEWSAPSTLPVAPGITGSTSISVDQDSAQSVYTPLWASGRPGSWATFQLGNWPSGYTADLYGYSEDPDATTLFTYTDGFASLGDEVTELQVRIPTSARPGYAYQIHASRSDVSSWLDLTDSYQVCTLIASKTKIKPRASVRLSGVIPTQGHDGDQAGNRKQIVVFARSRAGGQPDNWQPGGQGWKRVCTTTANGYGQFRTRLLKPSRSTWYVVRYPGDDWYWGAYTSVIKVTVKGRASRPTPAYSPTVYITNTGECYHRAGCRYLSHSCIPIKLSAAKAQGYRACKVCRPPT